jgi:hypothetical protein
MQGVLLDLALVLPIWKEAASALKPPKERAQALAQPELPVVSIASHAMVIAR